MCLLLTYNTTNSQSIEEIINFGDSLFRLKNSHAALNEYQRAFYFCNNNNKTEISQKIAECYLSSNEFRLAYNYYDTAFYYSANNSEKIECNFNKIQCLILEKNFGYALIKLEELETGSNGFLNYKKNLFQGICHYGLENYNEAFHLFYQNINLNDSLAIAQFSQLFEGRKKLLQPYPQISSIMSCIIPGSGQIYSGEFYNGINSIFLLSTLVFLGVYTPVLDFFVVFPFFYRYYMGGINNANRYARERKKEKQHYAYIELMNIFQENGPLKTLFCLHNEEQNYSSYFNKSVSEMNLLLSFSFVFYKKFLSSQDVDACVFYPSCSVYTIEAIEKNGSIIGLLGGFDRLLRCHAFVNKNDYPYNSTKKKYYDAL
jgi:putative component of membrane protein insertase Oxa1/YidC/SpoIIIJ protein YidD